MKTIKCNVVMTFFILTLCPGISSAQPGKPVNPNATPEAKALLEVFYNISGKYTFSGQHNYPNTENRNSRFFKEYTGYTPVIWSSDFGFSKKEEKDSYLARPAIVKEAIRQHKKGSIITLCWHAVPPTGSEPVSFQPEGKVAPEALNSVQGKMMEEQYKELLTPGTRLYNRWTAQVDTIARYLKQLQDAGVPVLWRPYHEMNGDWFWWGGRVGQNPTVDIYRQLYDRLVNYHKLNNLIWMWNVDRPTLPIRKFTNFYPGNAFIDIVSLDVYGNDFNQKYYDDLMALSQGKPLVFGEVGNPPVNEIYKTQPQWASWVIWAGMTENTLKKQYADMRANPRVLFQEDLVYGRLIGNYRNVCGLPALPLKSNFSANFSGDWIFNEAKSDLGKTGMWNVPASIKIDQDEELVFVKKFMQGEFGDDRLEYDDFYLDETPGQTEIVKAINSYVAGWDAKSQAITLKINTKSTVGDKTMELKSIEVWVLADKGKTLKISRTLISPQGETRANQLIFNKR